MVSAVVPPPSPLKQCHEAVRGAARPSQPHAWDVDATIFEEEEEKQDAGAGVEGPRQGVVVSTRV